MRPFQIHSRMQGSCGAIASGETRRWGACMVWGDTRSWGACMGCVLGHHVETHARETGRMPANPTDGRATRGGSHCIYYMYFMWLICRVS